MESKRFEVDVVCFGGKLYAWRLIAQYRPFRWGEGTLLRELLNERSSVMHERQGFSFDAFCEVNTFSFFSDFELFIFLSDFPSLT